MAQAQPQTKVLEVIAIKGNTVDSLVKKLGKPLGSPINGKNVGDMFDVTLTGKIEIREFAGNKGAYFTTKEGYSIRVNASFNPAIHKEGAQLKAICRELVTDERNVKFCALVD